MRTQSNVETETRPIPATDAGGETMSFRGSTIDEAVSLAEESLGAPVRVVAANRIRRGGIGGFFAADLGVEVSVALDDETIEQALERLVSETAADERTRWMEHIDGPSSQRGLVRPPAPPSASNTAPAAALATPAAPSANGLMAPRRSALSSPLSSPLTSPLSSPVAGPMASPLAALKTPEPVVRIAQRDEDPGLFRVEQIIEELQILTRRPNLPAVPAPGADGLAAEPIVVAPLVQRSVALPRLPPRSIDIAQAASVNAAASQATAVAVEQQRIRDMVADLPLPFLPSTLQEIVQDAAVAAQDDHLELNVTLDAGETEAVTGSTAPSQRQVELAVAATDQLIESLQRESGIKRVSVRVVLRTGDQSAVEAEAEWEAS